MPLDGRCFSFATGTCWCAWLRSIPTRTTFCVRPKRCVSLVSLVYVCVNVSAFASVLCFCVVRVLSVHVWKLKRNVWHRKVTGIHLGRGTWVWVGGQVFVPKGTSFAALAQLLSTISFFGPIQSFACMSFFSLLSAHHISHVARCLEADAPIDVSQLKLIKPYTFGFIDPSSLSEAREWQACDPACALFLSSSFFFFFCFSS